MDTTTNRVPESLQEFVVLERRGLRIGIIGLVERYAPTKFLHLDRRLLWKGVDHYRFFLAIQLCLQVDEGRWYRTVEAVTRPVGGTQMRLDHCTHSLPVSSTYL